MGGELDSMSNLQPDEGMLLRQAAKGDRRAFDQVVSLFHVRVYQFAFRLCKDREIAEDVTAESFVRVYTNLHRFRFDSQFTTWMFRIVTNCFLDLKKRERLRQHQSLDEMIQTAEGEVSRQLESSDQSPDTAAENAERGRVLEEAIQKLPEYQRAMIVMYHVEMMSYEEIAETMELPLGTVKSRLNRARLSLKEILEPVEELFGR